MKRLALTLRIGQHIILPSGNVAQVLEIEADTVSFVYLEDGGVVALSRALCLKYWGINEQRK